MHYRSSFSGSTLILTTTEKQTGSYVLNKIGTYRRIRISERKHQVFKTTALTY